MDYLYLLYAQKNFEELKIELNKFNDQINSSTDLTFLNAHFLEDGDAAAKIYETLSESSTGILKYYVRQKLAEYYYARGFYVKAAEWKSGADIPADLNARLPAISRAFKIQVGAFGFKENASKLHNYLETNNIHSEIIQRDINNKTLFCVWIDGKDSRDQTEKYAEEIKSKLRLNYQIVQP